MPDIKRWLKSNNDYVILFTLNIIYNFNRIETKEDLLLLLNHSNEIIRIKTIEIFSKFEFEEAKNILKENYTNLSINEKYAFWNYLKKIVILEDTSFILKHLKDADFEVKHIALEILFAINKEEFNLLEHNSNDETLNKIIHFINHNYGY